MNYKFFFMFAYYIQNKNARDRTRYSANIQYLHYNFFLWVAVQVRVHGIDKCEHLSSCKHNLGKCTTCFGFQCRSRSHLPPCYCVCFVFEGLGAYYVLCAM